MSQVEENHQHKYFQYFDILYSNLSILKLKINSAIFIMNSKLQQRSKTKSKGPKVSERISKARLDDKPSDKRVSSLVGLISSRLSIFYKSGFFSNIILTM